MIGMTSNELNTKKKNEETTKLELITPAIQKKWKDTGEIIMEYSFTNGRILIDEYDVAHREKQKRVDYLLIYKNNPIALVEAKGQNHAADDGYNQAVEYAAILDVPFAYVTNGVELIERDMISGINKRMKLEEFPSPEQLWERYLEETNNKEDQSGIITYPDYVTLDGKRPRYYQKIMIDRTIQAISNGQDRILLVSATGTGKTFTAFQIIYKLWKTRNKEKILYLADRNFLIDQTIRKDFKPFGDAMVKISNRHIDTSRDILLGLYQQLKTVDVDYYKQLPRDFFDLVIVDECHRGSASVDSNWHDILTYFSSAVQIGLTATPKDGGVAEMQEEEYKALDDYNSAVKTKNTKLIAQAKKAYDVAVAKRENAEKETNAYYFGNPLYTYSLKQGIADGYLAPYKVISVELDIDKNGYFPPEGMTDIYGNPVEQRLYTQAEFDRKIVVEERREVVAKQTSDFLKTNDMRYAKTIVFCEDISHCQEMVRLLENENADLVAEDPRYVMQITGDNEVGKAQLDNFVNSSSKYPVIAVTSQLLSTGVDVETCEVIVLDRNIGSMTEFKQIIGRGTRIKEHYEVDGEEKTKMYFTVLDFRSNYKKFNDPEFDGEPVTVVTVDQRAEFPKLPIKPVPRDLQKKQEHKVARINGVDVEIIGETVQYLDANGNLIQQNLTSCVKNNIRSQYSDFTSFKEAWKLANDKSHFASELLLENDWSQNFKTRYGYDVDDFDIIAFFGYDIEPRMSKHQRAEGENVISYLNTFTKEKRKILELMLNIYSETKFINLKDVKNTFSLPEFKELGVTPISVVKLFGGKEKYYKLLNELENKLYD